MKLLQLFSPRCTQFLILNFFNFWSIQGSSTPLSSLPIFFLKLVLFSLQNSSQFSVSQSKSNVPLQTFFFQTSQIPFNQFFPRCIYSQLFVSKLIFSSFSLYTCQTSTLFSFTPKFCIFLFFFFFFLSHTPILYILFSSPFFFQFTCLLFIPKLSRRFYLFLFFLQITVLLFH